MGTQGTGRKRSSKKEKSTAEDDALNLIARDAEARLAAKRAARAEAREIRMKELERQQKEIFQVQKKYYGLDTKLDDRADHKWGDIDQWMEDSERYSRSSRIQTLSDDDERMSVGSRGSVRSDLDAVGAYGGGDSLRKSKKKKKHKHKDKDRNGHDDDHSVVSSRSSRLSDESRASRSSRLELASSRLSDDTRASRASRLDLQPASYASSDLYSFNGLTSSRTPGSAFNGYKPLEYTSYRSSGSRASSRAGSARVSPVEHCSSVASYLRSAAAGGGGLPRDLDDVTIPDFPDAGRFSATGSRGRDVEDRDYLEKGSRAASALTAASLSSVGATSLRRGSGETAITIDAETSIREIKEIHELKDQIQDVETKYTQNLKEVKDAFVEVEEKYRKAMVSNAQLDNDKNNLMYQVDTLKDSLMELEELLFESRRGYEEKVKDHDREKHAHTVLQFQFGEVKETLKQSEELLNDIRQLRIKQEGFVREISDLQETVEWKDKKIGALERQKEYTDAIRIERDELREEAVKLKDIVKKHGIVLSPDLTVNGDIGEAEVGGSPSGDAATRPAPDSHTTPSEGNSILEIRLRKLVDEREKMIEQVKKLKSQLEQKTQRNGAEKSSSPGGDVLENGTDPDSTEQQRDASRQMSDFKFKLVKAEQEVTASEQNVTRLEGQVTRYKTAAENSEKVEDELKAEKRKLQRELRSALDKVDELESNNSHLSKRLEKMKTSRGMAQTP
ncbi:leucine-rich repeat flightless-interacting protein 2 isoform X19 [Pseudoliparis swirei]|uniref:leucine-rich repeat flightless-interacting protein 2 isoform X19 n=1 Tax=Pseudoliparis swirei TaxID=2059687 RepID=UPI0024BD7F87|nr:leucine-rich repeat flightless-interacting protein 2 isoform X19 [Pseudoliparis swirei]